MDKTVHIVKKEKKKKSLLLRLAVLAAFAYVLIVFVNQRITISQKRVQYNELMSDFSQQQIANEELKSLSESENLAAYVERIARETLNYVFPGEKIYVNIVGN